ncbi:uncharacterized protein V6R79_024855 [Siganus canaliculatus]
MDRRSGRRSGEDTDRRSGEDTDRRSGEDTDRRSGRRSGEDTDRRSGEDTDRRSGEDTDRRSGRRSGEDTDRRRSEDTDRRSGEDTDRRRSEDTDRRSEDTDRRSEDTDRRSGRRSEDREIMEFDGSQTGGGGSGAEDEESESPSLLLSHWSKTGDVRQTLSGASGDHHGPEPAGPEPAGDHPGPEPAGPEPAGDHHGPEPAGPEPAGDHPGPEPAGPEPAGDHHGPEPAGPEPAGDHPGPEPAGPEPAGDHHGPEAAGDRPGPEPAGDRPGPEPAGDRPGPEPAGDHPGPEPAGEHPGPEPAGDHHGPEPAGPEAAGDQEEQRVKPAALLDSCTVVEGLLFPVEYYIRTTRRMASSQTQPNVSAVLASQLSGGRRRRSRGRGRRWRSQDPDPGPAGVTEAGTGSRDSAQTARGRTRGRARGRAQSPGRSLRTGVPGPGLGPGGPPRPPEGAAPPTADLHPASTFGSRPEVYPVFLRSRGTARTPAPLPPLAQLAQGLLTFDLLQDFHLPDDQFASLKLLKLQQVEPLASPWRPELTPPLPVPFSPTPVELRNQAATEHHGSLRPAPQDSGFTMERPTVPEPPTSPDRDQRRVSSQLLLSPGLGSAPFRTCSISSALPSLGQTPPPPPSDLGPAHSPSSQAPPTLSPCPSLMSARPSQPPPSPPSDLQAPPTLSPSPAPPPRPSDLQAPPTRSPSPSPPPRPSDLQAPPTRSPSPAPPPRPSDLQAPPTRSPRLEGSLSTCCRTLKCPAGGPLVDVCCLPGPSGGVYLLAAGKWAVCVWSQTEASDWTLDHTWSFTEPVISVLPVPDAVGLVCVTLGQLEIRDVRVLSCCSLQEAPLCTGLVQAVVGVARTRVVTCSLSESGSALQVFTLSADGSSPTARPLAPPGVCVGALAAVDGLPDALIGTDEGGRLFIWNLKSGQLLRTLVLGEASSHTSCLRGFSSCGVLFVLLQHQLLSSLQEAQQEAQQERVALLSLVAINPVSRKCVVASRLFPPSAWSGRLCEADVDGGSVLGVSQTGCVCVWQLGGGGRSPAAVVVPESGGWRVARWGGGGTLLIGRDDGDVSILPVSSLHVLAETLVCSTDPERTTGSCFYS